MVLQIELTYHLLMGSQEDGLASELSHDAADRNVGDLVDRVQPLARRQPFAQEVADGLQAWLAT